jgi:hypothetical protein
VPLTYVLVQLDLKDLLGLPARPVQQAHADTRVPGGRLQVQDRQDRQDSRVSQVRKGIEASLDGQV